MRLLAGLVVSWSLLIAANVSALAVNYVELKLPAQFIHEVCPLPIWHNQMVFWRGVSDGRRNRSVGTQSKRGEVVAQIEAKPPLDRYLSDASGTILSACGLTLYNAAGTHYPTLSVEIQEFQVGEDKKIVTAEEKARSQLQFTLMHPSGATHTLTVQHEIEAKNIRRKNIRQLTQTLNQLLRGTLKQIGTVEDFRTFFIAN